MPTIDDVLAFVQANPKTYGHLLMSRRYDLYLVIESQPGKTVREKLYNYQHPGAWEQAQRCATCKAEGQLPFRAGAYARFCSPTCSANDPERKRAGLAKLASQDVQEKRRKTVSVKRDLSYLAYMTPRAKPSYGSKYEDPLHKAPIQQPPTKHSAWLEAMYAERQARQAELIEQVLSR
jgi:hypothetical protein